MNKVAERINLKFTSGNSIPVERAVIKTTEWQELLQELEAALSNERNKASSAWNAWRDKSDALESMRDELAAEHARADTLAQALDDHNVVSFATTIGGKEVHRSWRDTMLAQGREVAPSRMNWETLTSGDKQLDRTIAESVIFLFIKQIEDALTDYRTARGAK